MACSKSLLTGSCGVSCETQLGSPRLHRLDAEGDVIVQRLPEFLRAIEDVLAANAAREGFVLHLFPDRRDVDFEDAAGGFDVGDGGDEASQLVAVALHVGNEFPAGMAAITPGVYNTNSDSVRI